MNAFEERVGAALYPRLRPIAQDWYAKLGRPAEWPESLDEWLEQCHRAGRASVHDPGPAGALGPGPGGGAGPARGLGYPVRSAAHAGAAVS